MQWIFDILKVLVDKRFTGSLTLNFFEGGIANVIKKESIKPPSKNI